MSKYLIGTYFLAASGIGSRPGCDFFPVFPGRQGNFRAFGILALAALLEAYLGRRSAARVQAGAARRGTGETIRAALLSADLRDFTALSEATEPAAVIAALDAWFDRIAGAVHAFGARC
jgi:class 3 adenylate cyclase